MAKVKGNCTKFKRWNGTTWDTIGQVYSITPPKFQRDEVSNENFLDCGANGIHINLMELGSAKVSNVTLDLGFDPVAAASNESNQDLLVGDAGNDTRTYYMIELPNAEGSGFVFFGGVKNFDPSDISPDTYVHSGLEFTVTEALGALGFEFIDSVATYTVPASPAPVNI